MFKRLFLLAAALVVSFSAAAQTWQSDLTLAGIQLAAADRHLQAARDAKTDLAAVAALHQAKSAYALARTLYDQVAQQIEQESARLGWTPSKFTDYGDAQRSSRRADDGVSEATAAMMERIGNRGGARAQR